MTPSFRLVQRSGPSPGETYDLAKDAVTIGRDVTNDIVIADAEVSRQHARINRTPGGYVFEDLGSTNGSFINGERLVAPRVLNQGDLIGLGENVTVTFEASGDGAPATVMGSGQVAAPPQPAAPAPAPPPAQAPAPAVAPPPPAPAMEADGDRRRWIFAGCGCLLLLALCGGFLYFMDANYPDILYAPLIALGLGF